MGELLRHYEHVIEEIKLIPSDEGRVEVTVKGQLLCYKSQWERHAEAGEVLGLVRKLVGE